MQHANAPALSLHALNRIIQRGLFPLDNSFIESAARLSKLFQKKPQKFKVGDVVFVGGVNDDGLPTIITAYPADESKTN